MAETPGSGGQLQIPGHEADEVLAPDHQQVGRNRSPDCRRARPAVEQRHLAKGLPRPELGQRFDDAGGVGKPRVGQIALSYDPDPQVALKRAMEQFRWFTGNWRVNAELPVPASFDAASKTVRDTAFKLWQGGSSTAVDYLEAQQDFNDVVKQYRDALVRHRNAMLDLNTAVGSRVLP